MRTSKRFGSGETEYLNSAGKLVTARFRGLSFLDVIHDPPEHGSELMFHSNIGVGPDELRKLLRSKEQLELFRPVNDPEGPDVADGKILQELEQRFGIKRSR
jgi:hypothetical protein